MSQTLTRITSAFVRRTSAPISRSLSRTSSASIGTTVNKEEVDKFEKLAADWWNPLGDFKPLHSMNMLRVELIRNGLLNAGQIPTIDIEFPLQGKTILDIGCGGGILAQPLGRLGAQVVGLDAGQENIHVAEAALSPDLRDNVQFLCTTAEEYSSSHPEVQFDAVVASEVIEHVQDPKLFLQVASQLVKPSGSIFVTTLNRTQLSWMAGIVAAEYLLRLVPIGTHQWKNFISPEEVQKELIANGCRTRLVHGMCYNPLSNAWSWTRSTSINYALHAVKTA